MSGGQTGSHRAALDFAIERGIAHGGWCPCGRKAEDGAIDARYQLKETPSADYPHGTEWNVRDSDGTVIFSISAVLRTGSKKTFQLAQKLNKPVLHLWRDGGGPLPEKELARFIRDHAIRTLNVAGPRASKEPEVGWFVKEVLGKALDLLQETAPVNPVTVVLGNREALVNDMVEAAVRLTHDGINFRFETASRASDFIALATRPETRLAMFIPPGNIDTDPGISCATPEEEAVRIIKAVKAKNPIPIIVMAVQSSARRMLLAAGASAFLEIPAQAQEIADAVAKCLGL
jgi:hypothetical protein